MMFEYYLTSEQMTEQLAHVVAGIVSPPLVMGFFGEIGAGKTTFIRAMLRAMGVQGAIKSPTYALIESYLLKDLHLHHFDLYRIEDEEELEFIGFRDYFSKDSICCIEWPDRVSNQLEDCIDIDVRIKRMGAYRTMRMEARTTQGEKMLFRLKGAL